MVELVDLLVPVTDISGIRVGAKSASNGRKFVLLAVTAEDAFFSTIAARFFLCVRFRRRPRLRLPSVVDTWFVVDSLVIGSTEAYNGDCDDLEMAVEDDRVNVDIVDWLVADCCCCIGFLCFILLGRNIWDGIRL